MTKVNGYLVIAITVLIGIAIQILLIVSDNNDTPNQAVVDFTKAYYQLDPDMSERLCAKSQSADNVVKDYIESKRLEAQSMGFGINWLKYRPYHIETVSIEKSDNSGKIKMACKTRRSIHTIYSIVADIFHIGTYQEVEAVIDVVKEEDRWKVCGKLFSLPEV